jgi:hypothetical protein
VVSAYSVVTVKLCSKARGITGSDNYITQLALYVEHPAVVHGRMPAKRDR